LDALRSSFPISALTMLPVLSLVPTTATRRGWKIPDCIDASHRIFPKHLMDAFVHFVPKLVGGGMLVPSEKINPAVYFRDD
jgi:hypothetical protein